MPNPTNGTGQVPSASQSPDSNGQVPPVSQASSTDDDSAHGNNASEPSSNPKLTPEQLEDLNKKLRAENAKARVDAKRLAELEAAEQQRKDADLSDKDRADKKIAEYQVKLADLERATQERIVRSDIKVAAKELGIMPELALKLIDLAAIEYGEDGDPTNVAELLAELVQKYGLAVAAPQAQNATPQQPATHSAPAMSATNPPRGNTVAAPNGTFAKGEYPRVTDSRLWRKQG